MNDCTAIREQLADYAYELLPEWQMEGVREHLDACDACGDEYDRVKDELKPLDEWRVPGPGTDTSAEFVRRVSLHETGARAWPGLAPRPVGPLARWVALPRGAKVAVASLGLASVAAIVVLMATMSGQRTTEAQPQPSVDRSVAAAQRLYERGVGLLEAGAPTPAIETLRSAVLADPTHIEARWALAGALAELDGVAEAIAEYEAIVSLVPGTDRAVEAQEAISRLRVGP